MDTLCQELQAFGLTQYEAKTYLALLRLGRSNAYKVSKTAGIPRTRIYDILDALVERGVVMLEADSDGTKAYAPLPATVFLEQLRSQWTHSYGQLADKLCRLEEQPQEERYVSTVRGREPILAFCRQLLQEAADKIIVSLWDDLYQELLPELKACAARGCTLGGITFQVEQPLPPLAAHRALKFHKQETPAEWFILSVDSRDLLYGHSTTNEGSAFFTNDPTHIFLMEDYVFHDVLLSRLREKTDASFPLSRFVRDVASEMKFSSAHMPENR